MGKEEFLFAVTLLWYLIVDQKEKHKDFFEGKIFISVDKDSFRRRWIQKETP